MDDKMIVAILSVICYVVYMTVGPGGDGVIFGSLLGFLGLCAGIKVGESLQKNKFTEELAGPGEVE